jgi:hypothetical protein
VERGSGSSPLVGSLVFQDLQVKRNARVYMGGYVPGDRSEDITPPSQGRSASAPVERT